MSCQCSGGPRCCVAQAVSGPFKCPDCGTWWAGEHRCPPMQGVLSIYPSGGNVAYGNIPVRCTCPPDRGDNYAGSCPIHDTNVTYTNVGFDGTVS